MLFFVYWYKRAVEQAEQVPYLNALKREKTVMSNEIFEIVQGIWHNEIVYSKEDIEQALAEFDTEE